METMVSTDRQGAGMSRPFWLLLLFGLLAYAAIFMSGFKPVTFPDSPGYLGWENMSWREQLSHTRTPGYGWLVVGVKWLGGLELLPSVQFFINIASTLGYFVALHTLGLLPWRGFIIAAPFLVYPMVRTFSNAVLTDSVGLSMAVLAMACLYWTLGRPTRILPWLMLTLAVMASWMVRSMYVYMVVLIPVLGWVLAILYTSRLTIPLGKYMVRVLLAVLVPFLLYSTLRWVAVDNFGVVSVAGQNMPGIAVPLMSEETSKDLPEDLRPLFYAIMNKRKESGAIVIGEYVSQNSYNNWGREYNSIIYNLAWPAALEMYQGDRVKANVDLYRLYVYQIKQRPIAYLQWVYYSMVNSVRLAFMGDFLMPLLAFLLVMIWLCRLIYAHYRPPALPVEDVSSTVVIVSGVIYFVASTLAVSMVQNPVDRYTYATSVFINPTLMVAVIVNGTGLLQNMRGRKNL